MSVEFRQRTPGEYLKIIRRRKWLIILPVLAVTSAVAWVVYKLPDVYESTTLIVVKPSTLPNTVVSAGGEEALTRQLTSIAQVVTSRSSLEPLVDRYDLYKAERLRGEPMELIIGRVRKDIKVEINTSRNDITNGFNITVQGRDPRTAQAVTSELASKYISQQTQNTVNNTQSALQFINNQVLQAKEALDVIDKKRLDFMTVNVNNLPTQAASLVGLLGGLREQQKALINEVGRLQDRRSALAANLSILQKQTEQTREDLAKNITDPKTTLGWAQLTSRKADLQSQLTRMKLELKPKHPDVIAKQAELDSVQQGMDDLVTEWKGKIKEEQEKLQGRPDLQAANSQTEMRLVDGEIKRQQTLLAQNEKQIADIMLRINSVPGAEVQIGALDREYQTQKSAYDQLLVEQQKIALNAEAASQQQGESIVVVDTANLPSTPVAPKRFALSALGLGFGLGLGLLLTAIFEVPRLLTIQTSEDARHYTGLPVLISVPELLTPQEAKAIPRRRRLILAAGVVITMVSIPLLALVLKLTHVFEFLSAGRAS